MVTSARSPNGSSLASDSPLFSDADRAGPSADLLAQARSLPSDDASLFPWLAALTREAGREDLAAEFTRRAKRPASDPPASSRPTHPEAERWHDQGCRLVRDGKPAEAETALRTAVRLDPANPDAHGNLGVALGQLRRLPEAEAAFRLAIRLSPAVVTMYVNLATCLHQQGRHAETEEWARQAVQLDPAIAEAHRLLGCALEARNKFEAAETALAEAVRLDPRLADAQFRLGTVRTRREKPAEAETALRAAVRLKPDHAAAWSALSNLLGTQDRHPEAVDCARQAVQHEPSSADLHNCLGVALAGAERYAEAEAAYRETLRLNPALATAHSNLGNTLRSLGKLDEAERSLREALRLKPHYPEAHNNLGIVLVQMGRDEEGLAEYDEAVRLAPSYPEARMNRSFALLGAGEFARGWPEYEWRWKVKPFRNKPAPGPRWDGTPLAGKTLVLSAEQGLGDAIQFLRYAPLAKAQGAHVVFDAPAALVSLAATCPGVDQVVPRGQAGPRFDAHVPLMSLPGLFGVPPEAATAPVPYFTPDPERVAYWRGELAGVPGLRVGIAWQGSTAHKGDKLRSVPLTRFAPLAAVPGVSLCSIQKGFGSEQLVAPAAAEMGVLDLGTRIGAEMADAAALMACLDLIVSVDTAIVHLAGALGRPVWVAVPGAADWRWLRADREETPWYPSMRLFRQAPRGDWDPVFGRLAAALASAAKAKAEGRWDADPLNTREAGNAAS